MQIMNERQHTEAQWLIPTLTTDPLEHTVDFTGEELTGLAIIRSGIKTEPWEIVSSYVYNWTVKMKLDNAAKLAFH